MREDFLSEVFQVWREQKNLLLQGNYNFEELNSNTSPGTEAGDGIEAANAGFPDMREGDPNPDKEGPNVDPVDENDPNPEASAKDIWSPVFMEEKSGDEDAGEAEKSDIEAANWANSLSFEAETECSIEWLWEGEE